MKWIIFLIFVFLLVNLVTAHEESNEDLHHMMNFGNMFFGFGLFYMIFWIVIVILLVWFVTSLINKKQRRKR